MSGGAKYETPAFYAAEREYLSEEIIITNNKTGQKAIGYVGDAFDHQWVRTPGSIDITPSLWATLNGGKSTTNKNDVLDVSWEFTGKRSTQFGS
mgnify:CR=1 FL=1|jgi:hypothetical protein